MDSVSVFCDQLFGDEPGLPGSIPLDIDVETPSELFELLLLIMTNGMKRYYGQRINIADVSTEHIKKLQQYLGSIGFNLSVDKRAEPGTYMIDNKAYLNKAKLEDMTFTVAAHKSLFIVSFGFIPGMVPKWS